MSVTAPQQHPIQVMRRRGALILPLFALVWAAAGVSGIADPAVAWTVGIVVGVAIIIAIVLALRGGRTVEAARPLQMSDDWYRQLTRVNVLQAVGIGLAIVALVAIGRSFLIPAAVCLIVGVHFFPLARIFHHPPYTWTAAALCVVSVVGVLTLVVADGPASRAVVGLGAAITLLATSVHLALMATGQMADDGDAPGNGQAMT